MALPTWATNVTVALNVLTFAASTVACTFASIAAVGFRGTEWGRALAPLPVVFAAMTVSTGVTLHPATPADGVLGEASMTELRGLADGEIQLG